SMVICLTASFIGLIILAIFLVLGCVCISREARKQELREKKTFQQGKMMLIVGTEMLGVKAPEEVFMKIAQEPEKVVVVHMP
ncbi:hypothetical protein PFISCL1PPCAC_22962, partial [Pristionchus fissidentatus]